MMLDGLVKVMHWKRLMNSGHHFSNPNALMQGEENMAEVLVVYFFWCDIF